MSADPELAAQYEAFPYPPRDPRDEARRLVTGSPSRLAEIDHYLHGGRLLGRERPLRVLVAGGGTGDALVMLAQEAAHAGLALELTYVDLSAAARRIAEARLARRGLSARFVTGSFLDPALALPGAPFDYIDCCGVLHHLPDPAAGARRLQALLAPGGGVGLMVYGALGRTGVYPLQEALALLGGDRPLAERVALAREVVRALPPTNWLSRNPVIGDHRESEAGLVDLLLNARDRAYGVEALAGLVAAAGLAIASWIEPIRYDPSPLLPPGRARRALDGLEPLARAALAERLAGNIARHVLYLVRGEDGVVVPPLPEQPDAVPVPHNRSAAELAAALRRGPQLAVTLSGLPLSLPLPPLAGALVQRIDGRRPVGALVAEVAAASGQPADRVARQAAETLAALIHANLVLLRRASG